MERIVQSFLDTLGDDGYYIVKAEINSANKIEVEIDHDEAAISLETIVRLNRYIEEHLDREVEDYELEVSSAGLTSPLTSSRRFRKFLGKELEVLLKQGVKEVGVLKEVSDEGIVLEVERKEKPDGARRKQVVMHQLSIAFADIKRANYLLRF